MTQQATSARIPSIHLDKHGKRPCRRGQKCTWLDFNGNSHDLDFVLERGGTPEKTGIPAAFIETAWRRYTKHSRNKVQEIQGAIEPLAQTFKNSAPFKGAILAGVFTKGALTQLKSLGFTVLFFPYASVVSAFSRLGIKADFDEKTPDEDFVKKVRDYKSLDRSKRKRLAKLLLQANQPQVDDFLKSLSSAVSRQIDRIVILALHGALHEVVTLDEAIAFISSYDEKRHSWPVIRFEVEVRYNNGDSIKGNFTDKTATISFLKSYQSSVPKNH